MFVDDDFKKNIEDGEFSEAFEINGQKFRGVFDQSLQSTKTHDSESQKNSSFKIITTTLPDKIEKHSEIFVRGKKYLVYAVHEEQTSLYIIWLK